MSRDLRVKRILRGKTEPIASAKFTLLQLFLDRQRQLRERLNVCPRMKFHFLELGQNRNRLLMVGRSLLSFRSVLRLSALVRRFFFLVRRHFLVSGALCRWGGLCFLVLFLLRDLLIVRNISWIGPRGPYPLGCIACPNKASILLSCTLLHSLINRSLNQANETHLLIGGTRTFSSLPSPMRAHRTRCAGAEIQSGLGAASSTDALYATGEDPLAPRISCSGQRLGLARWDYYIPASGNRRRSFIPSPSTLDALPGNASLSRLAGTTRHLGER